MYLKESPTHMVQSATAGVSSHTSHRNTEPTQKGYSSLTEITHAEKASLTLKRRLSTKFSNSGVLSKEKVKVLQKLVESPDHSAVTIYLHGRNCAVSPAPRMTPINLPAGSCDNFLA